MGAPRCICMSVGAGSGRGKPLSTFPSSPALFTSLAGERLSTSRTVSRPVHHGREEEGDPFHDPEDADNPEFPPLRMRAMDSVCWLGNINPEQIPTRPANRYTRSLSFWVFLVTVTQRRTFTVAKTT